MGNFFSDLGGSLFGTDDEEAQFLDPTPSEFQALREPTSQSLQDIINSIQGGSQFSGTDTSRLVAPIGEDEQAALDRVSGLTAGPTDLQLQGREVLGQTIGGEFLDPSSNPFLQANLDSAIRRINEGTTENQAALIGQFKRAGQTLRTDPNRVGSSAFLNQARLSERDRLNAIGDITGSILGQNFQQERARQLDASKAAETISTQDIGNAIEGLRATALPRLVQDLGIQRGIQEFNKRIQTLLQALATSGNLQQNTQIIGPQDGSAGSLATLAAGAITGGVSGFGTSLAAGGGSQQGLNLLTQNDLASQFG